MQEQNEQISLGKLIGRSASSPAGLPAMATLCLVLMAFAPVTIFKIPRNSQLITLGLFDNVTISGLNFIGWWMFIPVVAFAASTMTRLLPAMAPYRKLADQFSFLSLAGVVIWALTGGSIGADIRQAREQMRGMMGSRVVDQFRFMILPYFGAILAVAAPALLIAARIREKPRNPAETRQVKSGGPTMGWLSAWGVGGIVVGLIGIAAVGFTIVGVVGFFVFGGVGPNWFRFLVVLILAAAVVAVAGMVLHYVMLNKLNRPVSKQTILMLLIGAGSAGAGITIALMTAGDRRVGAAQVIVATLVALIPFAMTVAIASRRNRSRG